MVQIPKAALPQTTSGKRVTAASFHYHPSWLTSHCAYASLPSHSHRQVHSAWAGYYEHNEFDSNGVIGFLPEVPNLLHVGGFSGHGLQHAAAAGRAAAEILADGELTTLDLRRLTPTRILDGEPLLEDYIV